MADPAVFDPRQFYDRTADDFAARWDGVPTPHAARFVELAAGGPVIDVAAGSGRDARALRAGGLDVVAADLSFGQCHHAARHTPTFQADFCHLPLPDAVLTGVWACAAIVHCTPVTAAAALREMRRCTRPGGVLHIEVKTRDASVDEDGFDGRGRWFQLWTPAALVVALADTGWVTSDWSIEAGSQRASVDWLVAWAIAR